ncbi:uncharacterized protein NPIL_259911 [Nephila pilipes]|uniref:Cyclic nucleotide phosphodiesterase catalytic domain-containing protein n=1 Tax=Nephila pilipes TaxID=299642 RepID=A0A8X6MJW4_NEPPI|nr:uncharacterized protein NPIL_259911 [Nephila pilipes]
MSSLGGDHDDASEQSYQSSAYSRDKNIPLNYFPLKMTNDKKTEMYVKFAKVMVISQGSYKGRTEAIKSVENQFKYTSCILSDESFRKQSKISCCLENVEDFYDYLMHSSQKALEEGNNVLIIDSTMPSTKQNQYYAALAYKMQYVVLVLPPVVTNSVTHWPKDSFANSFQSVTVIQPTNMFQHLFSAWYLHDIDSHELRHEASLYIQDCMEVVPEFRDFMCKICTVGSKLYFEEDSDEKEILPIDSIRKFYFLTNKRQDLAFCALKIFGNALRVMNEYFKKEIVQNNYGKMSKLLIAGFIISPYMIAARVKLTHHQRDLWEMEDEMDESRIHSLRSKPVGPLTLLYQTKEDLPGLDDVRLIASKSNQTLITGQTVGEPLNIIPKFGKGRACHIVLGKAPNAPPYQVDYGVQFALHRENMARKSNADIKVEELDRCVMKRIGKYWFIYLKEMLKVDAIFASCVKPYSFGDPIDSHTKTLKVRGAALPLVQQGYTSHAVRGFKAVQVCGCLLAQNGYRVPYFAAMDGYHGCRMPLQCECVRTRTRNGGVLRHASRSGFGFTCCQRVLVLAKNQVPDEPQWWNQELA